MSSILRPLFEIQAALWMRRAQQSGFAFAVAWRNQRANFDRWESILSAWDACTEAERRCIALVVDQVMRLPPLMGTGWHVAPQGHPVDEWGVDNAIGWLQNETCLPDVVPTSLNRGEGLHNGNAVDFGATTKRGWQALARVFLTLFPKPYPYGIGIGLPPALQHLHVDYRGTSGASWVELQPRERYSQLVYAGRNTPGWEHARASIRTEYGLAGLSAVPAIQRESAGGKLFYILAAAAGGAALGYNGRQSYFKPALYAAGAGGAVYLFLSAAESLSNALDRVTGK